MKFIFFVVVIFFQTIIFSQTGNEDSLKADGPILQLDTNIFDFGKIPAHKERWCTHKNFVKIKNVGNKPLIVFRAVISTGGVYADYRECQKPLFPGDSAIITIHYGSHRYGLKFQGSLTISSNSIDGEVKVVRIKGEFLKPSIKELQENLDGPVLQFDSNVINLGEIIANRNGGSFFVNFKNIGSDTLFISRLKTNSGVFYASYRPKEIPPGGIDSVKVSWTYRGEGKFSRGLTIRSNSIDKELKVIRLTGEFVKSDLQKLRDSINGPILMIDTSQLNLGDIPKSDSEYIMKTIYIRNIGIEPLRIMRLESLRDGLLIPRYDYSQNPILPGEVGAIFIQIKTGGLDEGSFNRKIYVGSNSGDNEKKSFLISWQLTKPLETD